MRLPSILNLAKRFVRKSNKRNSQRRRNIYRLGQFAHVERLEDRRLLAIIDITATEISTNTTWNSAGDTYRLMNHLTVRNNATLTVGPNVTIISNNARILSVGTDGTDGRILGSDSLFNTELIIGAQGRLQVSDSTFNQQVTLASGATPILQNNTFGNNLLLVAPELIDNLGNTNTYGSTTTPNGTIHVLQGTVASSMVWPALPGLARYTLRQQVGVRAGAQLTVANGLSVETQFGHGLNIGTDGTAGSLAGNNVDFVLPITFGSMGGGTIINSSLSRDITVASGANPVFTNNTISPSVLFVAPEFVDDLGNTNSYGSTTSPDGTIHVLQGTIAANMSWPVLPGLANYSLRQQVTVRNGARLTVASGMTVASQFGHALNIGTDGTAGELMGNNVSFLGPIIYGSQGSGNISNSTIFGDITIGEGASPVFTNDTFGSNVLYVVPEFVDNLGNTNTYGSTTSPNGNINVLQGTIATNMPWPALPGMAKYSLRQQVTVRNGARLTVATGMTIESPFGHRLNVGTDGTVGELVGNNVTFLGPITYGSLGSGNISNSTLFGEITIGDGASPVFQNDTFGSNVLYVVPEFIANLGNTNTYGSTTSPNGNINVLQGTIATNVLWPALPGLTKYSLRQQVTVRNGAKLTVAAGMTVESPFGHRLNIGTDGTSGNLEAIGVNFTGIVSLGANAIARIEHSTFTGQDFFIDGNIDATTTLRFNDFSGLSPGKLYLGNAVGGSATVFDLTRNFWGTVDVNVIDTMVVDDNESALRPTGDFAPMIAPGSVGRIVWRDLDQDGVQDSNEPGVAGIGVKLFRADNTEIDSTTTAATGAYVFENVPNGNFYVEYTLTDGQRQIFTNANQGNDFVDSDAASVVGLKGKTALFNFQASSYNFHMDAGLLISEPPVIGGLTTNLNYSENNAALNIAASATVTDTDSPNFHAGRLTISITSSADAADRLGIRQANGITVSGNQVLFAGQAFGVVSFGTVIKPMTVSLNANSNSAKVQTLLRNIWYRSLSDNPLPSKTITLQLTDGDGGTSLPATVTISIQPSNDKPALTVGDLVSYSENAVPVILAASAGITDPDSADFDTGVLSLGIVSGGTALDKIGIRNQGTGAGQIGVSGNDVMYGGVVIGTKSGGDGLTPLQITLNANASLIATRALLRNTTFETLGDTPDATQRSISITLSDGDTGISDAVTKLVNVTPVQDAPVFTNFGASIQYIENAVPLRLTTTATLSDVDSTDFDTGTLTVRFAANGKAEDRLTILNAGSISTLNNEVLYSGVTLGTFAGGVGLTPLVITLNATANAIKTQALVRNVAYSNVSENPSATARTVGIRLSDGDGATSVEATKLINVSPRNDASVLAAIDGDVSYVNNAAGIFVATAAGSATPTATVADVDSPNFDQGKLTIRAISGAHSSNRIEFSGTAFSLDASNNLLRNGVIIGSLNANGGVGMTKFEVTFNTQATAPIVQQLLRSIKFRTTSSASTAPRVLSYTLTDGDGGTSNTLTKTINVS
jgi:SdrD B-like domain